MTAWKPDLHVTFGATDAVDEQLSLPSIEEEGYDVLIRHTPEFDPQLPERLGVPHVDDE